MANILRYIEREDVQTDLTEDYITAIKRDPNGTLNAYRRNNGDISVFRLWEGIDGKYFGISEVFSQNEFPNDFASMGDILSLGVVKRGENGFSR